jgi:hypothetical protein
LDMIATLSAAPSQKRVDAAKRAGGQKFHE